MVCLKQPLGDVTKELQETHSLLKLQQKLRGAIPAHFKLQRRPVFTYLILHLLGLLLTLRSGCSDEGSGHA